jgi:hypothetical protein
MTNFKILNMIGQTVAKGNVSESIDVSQLNAGVYFIKFSSDKKVITQKFVKE